MEKELSVTYDPSTNSVVWNQLPGGAIRDKLRGGLGPYDDSQIIFELIQRGYAVALVPAGALAEELGA